MFLLVGDTRFSLILLENTNEKSFNKAFWEWEMYMGKCGWI